jgi:hypothetical protein
MPLEAQRDKKGRTNKKSSDYAFETYSTTKRKEKLKGYAGDEPKFNFEKPVTSVPNGKNSRPIVTTNPAYRGHFRQPVRKVRKNPKYCRVCGMKH